MASFNYWKARRERMFRKMAAMRAAKARKRLARGARQEEPKMERWYPLEFGVRDTRTGEVAWHPLRSVRHSAKALGLVLKYIL